MKVMIVQCLICKDVLYSRTEFDKRSCTCKAISVTGHPDKPNVLLSAYDRGRTVFKKTLVKLPYTSFELFTDYNDEIDKLGTIRKPRGDKKSYKLLISHTKMVLEYNIKKNNKELVELFKNQLNLLEEENARFQL